MFISEGDERCRDVPASVETHHFGLHIPIRRLQKETELSQQQLLDQSAPGEASICKLRIKSMT